MVSIIIPLYNAEKFIKTTVDSCCSQTYQDIEIYVVDDCSTDSSIEIVKKLQRQDSRIKILKNEKNSGVIKTANAGLQACSGKYAMVLGNDDVLEPEHIECMVKIMEQDDYSFLYCSSIYINEAGEKTGQSDTKDISHNPQLLLRRNVVNACGLLMNVNKLREVGWYPEYLGFRNYGEWYLWIKLCNAGKVGYVSQIKSNYRIHSNNLTKTLDRRENLKNVKRYNLACMKLAANTIKLNIGEKVIEQIYRLCYAVKMNIRFCLTLK